MTEQEKKETANDCRDLADKVVPALDPVSKPAKPETSEEAQRIHEAALNAFNTKGGVSLNSATPKAALEDLLKEKPAE